MTDEIMEPLTKDEYTEYWMTKGALQARNDSEFRRLSKEKEEKFKMLVELTVPWQRDLVTNLIDDIQSIENARSSIEMDNTIKLIYDDNNKK